jgi:serine/threonine protein kinase
MVNVKFNLAEIKKIIQQLLNGLYFLHSNKILHRDMKAANILITKNGLYQSVTTRFVYLFGLPLLLTLKDLASPKSANFSTPFLVIRILAAFMSRCKIFGTASITID